MKFVIIMIVFLTFGYAANSFIISNKEDAPAFETIKLKTFKLNFILKATPGNGWHLKLNKDGSYEYYHWSDYSGTKTLEKGKYSLIRNQLELKSDNESSELKSRTYFLVSSKSKDYNNYRAIACDMNGKPYCLCRKK